MDAGALLAGMIMCQLYEKSAGLLVRPRDLAVLLVLLLFLLIPLPAFPAPPLMLANVYQPGVTLEDYWVSEKLDGVRAYWDGRQLLTRAGNPVNAPAWFTAGWPDIPMDGELWAGRGRFEQASATVRQSRPDDVAWRGMRFMVFDLPAHPAVFNERLSVLKKLVTQRALPQLQMVPQSRVDSHKALMLLMQQTVNAGGEGLMLHRGSSQYRAERNDDLLKLKPWDDAEAIVLAQLPGKGKYTGMMGALLVETPEGLRFRLGSGFSDAQRQRPPVVGSRVTYRYRGRHASGIPRFASFLRVREGGE